MIRGAGRNANPQHHQTIETAACEWLGQRNSSRHANLNRLVEICDPVEVFTEHQIAAVLLQLRLEILRVWSEYQRIDHRIWKRVFETRVFDKADEHETIGHHFGSRRAAPALRFQFFEVEAEMNQNAVV